MPEEKLKYISLQEATKHCFYSQEYLSLIARQGKLRAIKIGRNWVTTEEWMKEYVARIKEGNNRNHQREKSVSVSQTQTEKLVSEFSAKEFEEIPQQNQGGDFDYVEGSLSLRVPKMRFPEKIPSATLVALFFLLLFTGVVLGKENFKDVLAGVKPYAIAINQNIDFVRNAVLRETENVGLTISHGVETGISQGWEGTKYGVEILGSSIGSGTKELSFSISRGIRKISQTEDFVSSQVSKSFGAILGSVSQGLSFVSQATVFTLTEITDFGLAGLSQIGEIFIEIPRRIGKISQGAGQGIEGMVSTIS